jgi:uncharacterized protein YggT (Ycf19 family)
MYTTKALLYLIDFIFGIIEILIGLRLILKFLGANPSTPFVSWVYSVSYPLIYPFQGIFPSSIIQGRFYIEISALVALLVYALIDYLIGEFVNFLNYHSSTYYTRTQVKKVRSDIRE